MLRRQVRSHRPAQINEFDVNLAENLHIPQKGYMLLLAVSLISKWGNTCASS